VLISSAPPRFTPFGLRVRIGYALPPDSSVATVTLNGNPASYQIRETHRGREIIVTTNSGQPLQLIVTTKLLISQVLNYPESGQLLLEAQNRSEEVTHFFNSFQHLFRNELKSCCLPGANNAFNFVPCHGR
jgi:hypothetical protein